MSRAWPVSRLGWRPSPTLALAGIAPVLLAATLLLLVPPRLLVPPLGLLVFLLASYTFFVDSIDLAARLLATRRRHAAAPGRASATSIALDVGQFTPHEVRLHLRPWAIVVSVHNIAEGLADTLEALAPFRDRLWVIDDASTDASWFLLQRAGVHAVRGEVNRKKPAAIRELLRQLPPEIETVLVIDPDISLLPQARDPRAELERVVFEFQRSGCAALCPRVDIRPDGWLARVQALEYDLACRLGRRSLADACVTSGVAVYRRSVLEQILERHSLSVYAEDLENALLLLERGERVYYDDRLVAQTEGKRSLRAWFSQRVGWSYGLLKVWIEQAEGRRRAASRSGFLAYHYTIYVGLLTLLLHPMRLVALVLIGLSMLNGVDALLGLELLPDGNLTDPRYFAGVYFQYTVFALVAAAAAGGGGAGLRRHAFAIPVYFFYALAHFVPVTIGYLNWLSLRYRGRRLYRDHFETDEGRVNGNGR